MENVTSITINQDRRRLVAEQPTEEFTAVVPLPSNVIQLFPFRPEVVA